MMDQAVISDGLAYIDQYIDALGAEKYLKAGVISKFDVFKEETPIWCVRFKRNRAVLERFYDIEKLIEFLKYYVRDKKMDLNMDNVERVNEVLDKQTGGFVRIAKEKHGVVLEDMDKIFHYEYSVCYKVNNEWYRVCNKIQFGDILVALGQVLNLKQAEFIKTIPSKYEKINRTAERYGCMTYTWK